MARERKPVRARTKLAWYSRDKLLQYCREGNLTAVSQAAEAGYNVTFVKSTEQCRTTYGARSYTYPDTSTSYADHSIIRVRRIVETPLSTAIFYGQKDVAIYLAQRCNVNESCTYPHKYAYTRDENWGFDVSGPGTETAQSFQNPKVRPLTVIHSPLTLAITLGSDVVVNHLLDAGANPLLRPTPVEYSHSDYVTALHMALFYKAITAKTIRKMVAIINQMRRSNPAIPEITDLLGREFSAPMSISSYSCCLRVPDSVKVPRSPFAIVEREIGGFTEGRTDEDLHAALSYRGTDVDTLTGRDKPEVVPVSSDEIAGPGAGVGAGILSPSTVGRPLLIPSSKHAVTPV